VTLATAGAAAGFAALTQLPFARAAWILAAALVTVACWRARGDPRRPPAHRLAASFVFCLAAAALVVAFHPSSNEERLLEAMRFGQSDSGSLVLPPLLAWLAIFLLSGGLCTLGLRLRDRVVLGAGLAAVAVFLLSAAIELRPHPLWLVLTVAGGLLVAATIAIGRWLERGRHGERGGWTADSLAEGLPAAPLESAAALATAAASAHSTPVESGAVPLRGDDGEFGGGGATGSY
jgi:hypothetical protein